MGVLDVSLLAASAAGLGYWVLLTVRLHRQKPQGLSWRGIIKSVALQGMPQPIALLYGQWFAAFWALFLLLCITVARLVWATDHSFLVVLFPLLLYYFFARYFLWEKEDLAD